MQSAGTTRRPARARALLAGAGLLLATLATGVPAASAYPGAPWFEPDEPYTDNFPDPDVLRVGDTYYAYGTSTGGAYLPVSRSTDLRTWLARSAYKHPSSDDPFFNDALPQPASWAPDVNGGRLSKEVWAPGVAQIGGRFVAFYSIRTVASPERFCISVATSDSPEGPFTDNTSGPLQCDSDPKGSIDPNPFVDPATGTPYLIWKSEGVPGSMPSRIWVRQLDASGTSFAPGSGPRELLRTSQGWEGNLIENPSMVRHNGQLYLFYSANEWASADYATGYATCSDVLGPCTKPHDRPLLASSGDRLGPGAPDGFVDAQGRLQLAYHYWNAPYTNYPAYPECERNDSCETQGQRRMAITELSAGSGGLQVGPARPSPTAKTTEQACPPDRVPEDGFGDVDGGNVHESAIDCVAWWEVTAGSNGRYLPAAGVTRGQMASFLARSILNSGGELPAPGKDRFRDDNGTTHEDNINRLAAAGIVNGVSADSYAPSAPVTRAQMATFLVRTVQHRTGQTLSSGTDWFYDDGGTHEPNINAAAGAGLATGTGGGAYTPGATVRRDQMASFLSRMLELFVEAGAPTPSR